ncbi:gas vesicle protein GvpO [Streptomyces sp. NPDC004726]
MAAAAADDKHDRKPAAGRAPGRGRSGGSSRSSGATARAVSAPEAMGLASSQLAELLGRAPQSVSALKPTDDGWVADVEIVELERVPDTTSVMASYRVSLDPDGGLRSYERIRRYSRGQIDRPR